MTSPLALFAALVGLALLGFAAWLMRAEALRQTIERVRSVAGHPQAAGGTRAIPSIRLPDIRSDKLTKLVGQILAYNRDLPQALVIPLPAMMAIGVASLVLGWTLATYMLGPALALPLGPTFALLAVRFTLKAQYDRYAKKLFLQLPDALGLILRALSAGLPIIEAVRNVAREMPQPTSEQFLQVVGATGINQTLDQAFLKLYQRSGVTEYAFLAVTLGLQAQTGGSLAETLDNLADTVRKRVAMEARARALASESRMSARIVTILPFVAGGAMSFLRPGFLSFFWTSSTGFKMLITGLCLLAAGSFTIRWLIKQATAE